MVNINWCTEIRYICFLPLCLWFYLLLSRSKNHLSRLIYMQPYSLLKGKTQVHRAHTWSGSVFSCVRLRVLSKLGLKD